MGEIDGNMFFMSFPCISMIFSKYSQDCLKYLQEFLLFLNGFLYLFKTFHPVSETVPREVGFLVKPMLCYYVPFHLSLSLLLTYIDTYRNILS